MRNLRLLAVLAVFTSLIILGADWPMPGGNPQRNGWAKSERVISKENVHTLQLLYRYQADNMPKGPNSLTAPIVNGNLITYRGFKEMLMFAGSSDKVFSVDADLNKILWESRLPYKADKPPIQTPTFGCPGGLSAPVVMAGNSAASMHFAAESSRTPAASGVRPRRPSPYLPSLAQSIYPMTPTTLTQLAALYTVSSDGYLHVVNSSTGQDLIPAIRFVPANAKVSSLLIRENIVYATTADNCDGYLNALYSLDLLSQDKKVTSFIPQGGGFSGSSATAIGNDGTVYVQTGYAPGDELDQPHETVFALTSKELKVKDYFVLPGKSINSRDLSTPGISPLVFSWMGKDAILAGSRNGRLYLLDSTSLGGSDHHSPLFESEAFAQRGKTYDGNGFRGAFSSWLEVDTGTRWFYAPLFGSPAPKSSLHSFAGSPVSGGIAAFKLAGSNRQPSLEPAWMSRDIASPAPVVIANGMAFALSTGESPRTAAKNGKPYSIAEWNGMATHATLYVLDADTGKELYSSGNAVPDHSHSGGLAIANGRVYFPSNDSALNCFGFLKAQPQLSDD